MSRLPSLLASFLVLSGVALAACATDGEDGPASPDVDSGVDAGPADTGVRDAQTAIDGGDVPVGPPTNVCGNGKREGAEECDDGNLLDNDGCSSTCKIEVTSPADYCPGETIALTPAPGQPQLLHGSVTGTTNGSYNHFGSACGGGSGRDVVYAIAPPSSGKATVTITAEFPAIVSTRTTCDNAQSETGCQGIQSTAGGTTKLEVPVFAGAPTFVVVDGYGGTSGEFTLDVEVSAAVCGNGVAELPEQCDDGNTQNGDGCSGECTLETGGVVDNCPGQPFLLTGAPGAVRKMSFAGNTMTHGATTQQSIGCFYWAGPNMVYALKSDVAGSVKAHLSAGYTKANLHARSDCGATAYQLGCTQREEPGGLDLEFPVGQNQWFYLFVEGHRQGSVDYAGPFTLDVTVTPSACGNGALDGNEQCDDGNMVDGDGCSATCQLEARPAAGSCPGHPLALVTQGDGTRTATIANTTTGASNSFSGCGTASGTAPDVVYAVTPDIDGLLTADVKGAFNTIVYVHGTCADSASRLACSYNANATTNPFILDGLGSVPKQVTTPVLAGTTYYVFVDSAVGSGTPASGAFKLDLKVSPAVCGNGVIEGGEQCDDGGTDNDDGCSSSCQIESHGPRTCAAAEAVTLAPTGAAGTYSATLARGTTGYNSAHNFTTTTNHVCQAPGREAYFAVTAPEAGILRARVDSAAFDAVLGFRKPCATSGTPLACGNDAPKGATEALNVPIAAGETLWVVVDTASAADFGRFTLDLELTPSGCGDGFFVPSATEECDDGNTVSGDGCSSTCKLESLPAADTCPGVAMTLTGSGNQPRRGVLTLDTSKLTPSYVSACGGNARDGVVRVVPNTSGLLTARINGLVGGLVHARTVCGDPASELKKSNLSTCPSVVHEVITFPVTANKEYFLFMDGLDGASGVATLDVTVVP